MKRWVTFGFLLLIAVSTILISVSYATHRWYGDLRDYYPLGLYIKTHKLDYTPQNYMIIENDTYIEQAIASGNSTWVQQDDYNSTYVNQGQGLPDYIYWVPDGSYYFVSRSYEDGIPDSWKLMPPPVETGAWLMIPWGVFLVFTVWDIRFR